MAEPDEAELAAERLEAALNRIEARQDTLAEAAAQPRINPRIVSKLDNLIRALRTALDH
jgi:hypothetical protein